MILKAVYTLAYITHLLGKDSLAFAMHIVAI
jgi:hypothetical protein